MTGNKIIDFIFDLIKRGIIPNSEYSWKFDQHKVYLRKKGESKYSYKFNNIA